MNLAARLSRVGFRPVGLVGRSRTRLGSIVSLSRQRLATCYTHVKPGDGSKPCRRSVRRLLLVCRQRVWWSPRCLLRLFARSSPTAQLQCNSSSQWRRKPPGPPPDGRRGVCCRPRRRAAIRQPWISISSTSYHAGPLFDLALLAMVRPMARKSPVRLAESRNTAFLPLSPHTTTTSIRVWRFHSSCCERLILSLNAVAPRLIQPTEFAYP